MNGMISVSVLAGLYWKRATSEGAFASTLGGMITYLIWTFSGNPRGINAVIPGLIVGIVLLIGGSAYLPSPKMKRRLTVYGRETYSLRMPLSIKSLPETNSNRTTFAFM